MADSRDRPATLLPPPLIYPAGLAAGWMVNRFLPLEFSGGEGMQLFSLFLVSIGLALIGWAAYVIWRHNTTVNPYGGATHLVSSGPFGISRNPIYLADWLIYAGLALWLKTWWALPFVPVVWWIMRYHVIRHEEAHLEAKFGQAYLDYKARVRRWI